MSTPDTTALDDTTRAPFDPDTLPPHLRATLDRISDIRMRMLEVIDRRRTERLAAEAAQAQATQTKGNTDEPTNTARSSTTSAEPSRRVSSERGRKRPRAAAGAVAAAAPEGSPSGAPPLAPPASA